MVIANVQVQNKNTNTYIQKKKQKKNNNQDLYTVIRFSFLVSAFVLFCFICVNALTNCATKQVKWNSKINKVKA